MPVRIIPLGTSLLDLTDAGVKKFIKQAKARGYDGKAMRTILQLRKLDRETRQQQQAMVDLYETVLGMK